MWTLDYVYADIKSQKRKPSISKKSKVMETDSKTIWKNSWCKLLNTWSHQSSKAREESSKSALMKCTSSPPSPQLEKTSLLCTSTSYQSKDRSSSSRASRFQIKNPALRWSSSVTTQSIWRNWTIRRTLRSLASGNRTQQVGVIYTFLNITKNLNWKIGLTILLTFWPSKKLNRWLLWLLL